MCCVSDLLSEEPVIHSGRKLTFAAGKDTGRYWDAGAANVHWVIATDEQVEAGINEALSRVKSEGVFVEGNSFSEFVIPDFFIMVAGSEGHKMKGSARRALSRVSAVYISSASTSTGVESIRDLFRGTPLPSLVPFFNSDQLAPLAAYVGAKIRTSHMALTTYG